MKYRQGAFEYYSSHIETSADITQPSVDILAMPDRRFNRAEAERVFKTIVIPEHISRMSRAEMIEQMKLQLAELQALPNPDDFLIRDLQLYINSLTDLEARHTQSPLSHETLVEEAHQRIEQMRGNEFPCCVKLVLAKWERNACAKDRHREAA